jgi:hypothetical protein
VGLTPSLYKQSRSEKVISTTRFSCPPPSPLRDLDSHSSVPAIALGHGWILRPFTYRALGVMFADLAQLKGRW